MSGKSLGHKPNLTEEASAYNMNIPSYNIAFFDKLNYSGLKFCIRAGCVNHLLDDIAGVKGFILYCNVSGEVTFSFL